MSCDDDVTFQVYYDGKFVVSEGNAPIYVGGAVNTLESKPEDIFTSLKDSVGLSLFGQRIWYKLPFEEFTELKLLYNGSENFQRMCLSTKWTKAADIFLEYDEISEERNDGRGEDDARGQGDGDNARGQGDGDNARGQDDGDNARGQDDGDNVRGMDERTDGSGEEDENDDVGPYEDEDYNSEATPPNSDCDEDAKRYGIYKKGSGEIRLGQGFDSIPQFKEAVVDYALREGFNVKFSRWGPEKSEVICAVGGGCKFRIYCSIEKPIGKYLVKTYNQKHSYIKDGYSKVVKDVFIAKLLLNDIRKDPTYKPKLMQEALEEHYNLIATNDQCRKAKAKALTIIQAEHDEQFARLKDYRLELMDSNPESTVELGTVTIDGVEKFDRFYLCFASLRKSWLAHCRPIIGIDGCFLKNNVKGQLLTAIGRDANNQFFYVAWAIVPIENTESWVWFIKHLKNDLALTDGSGFTLISDRQKSPMLLAVDQELPRVEHRMCARHIYGNLRRAYPGKELPKDLFWAAAKSFNIGDYERAMEDLKSFDKGMYEAVMQKNPHNYSRAFFTCTSVCEDVSNNFSESYNNTMRERCHW